MHILQLLFSFAFIYSAVLCSICDERKSCGVRDNFCNKLCNSNGTCEIRAAVILPNDTNQHIASLPVVVPLLKKAIIDARKAQIIPSWLGINLIEKDDQCSASYAQIATIDTYAVEKDNCSHVIFGPVCDYSLASVSRIVQFYATPLLTAGGFSNDFDKDKIDCEDEYFMLVRTGLLASKGLSQFFVKLALSYNWHKVAFLYDKQGQQEVAGENTCSFMMQSLALDLSKTMETMAQQFQYKDGDLGLSTMSIENFLKEDIGVNYGIIVMCASRERIHEILLAAMHLENMMYDHEYLFFNIELNSAAPDPDEPWKDPKYNETTSDLLKDAYKNVVTLTSASEEINDTNSTAIRVKSQYTSGFYDAMMLYLNTINDFLLDGGPKENINTTINGYSVVCNMYNRTFQGLNGQVEMNQNGDRKTHYSLLKYNPDRGKFDVVAHYVIDDKNFTFVEGKDKFWRVPETDTPICGYNSSKCASSFPYAGLSGFLAVILLIVISFVIYQRLNFEKEIVKTWLIKPDEVHPIEEPGEGEQDLASVASIASESHADEDLPLYIYKNTKVVAKHITSPFDVYKHASCSRRLLHMLDIQHDNLIKFYGIWDGPPKCVIMEYAPRRSLQNILKTFKMNEKTSELITMSFMYDIVMGMEYLHTSEIRVHGALTSSNCVVDSRLMVKLTDFGIRFLYDSTGDLESDTYWRKKLYSSPELLKENAPTEGTQKGDIYAFAIIVHEIIVRRGPFYLGEDCKRTHKDIVDTVRNGTPILRPLIDESSDKEVADLMRRCWAEDAADRPDFPALKNTIRKLNKKHDSGNILDNLLSRLEQYANNLETLVEERTADYLEEKRKCEELLYQLLPKSVASQLINGKSVIAETYDQVTIYFSDIVGFTSLSAVSAPLEVVEFLNDLYTCFDSIIENFDVYKVETIGDAYMVVSGLPVRNGRLHAREIARMGLALLKNVYTFKIKHRPDDQLKLRIGMHSGPCVAGVVGLKMPRYCLFGDTVNTASRMESNGEEQRIHVSPQTKELLDFFGCFELERRGEVELKGKGKMVTYWLNGEKSSSTEPPSQRQSQTQPYPACPMARIPPHMVTTSTNTSSSCTSSPVHVAHPPLQPKPKKGHGLAKYENPTYVDDDSASTSASVPLLHVTSTSETSTEKDS